MPTEYREQDTERAREMEGTSAGRPTQQLAAMPPAIAAGAAGRENLPALALIAIGGLMLLGRLAPGRVEVTGGMVLLTIASCFLFFALWRRIYGLLIPGCLLAGLSLGVAFASISHGVSVLWGLALGFLAILLVGRGLFNVRSIWPVYPALPLFAVGVIIATTVLPPLFAGGLVWLPLLLIGLGFYLGWVRR